MKDWDLLQLDANNALLHWDLDEDGYMELLLEFQPTNLIKARQLRKSLYEIKQGSQIWFEKFTFAVKDCNFCQADFQ